MKFRNALGLAVVLSMLLASVAAASPLNVTAPEPDEIAVPFNRPDGASHRLIVELSTPPLALYAQDNPEMLSADGKVQLNSTMAQQYVAMLDAEQQSFMNSVSLAMPSASVASFTNELGEAEAASFKIAFNGVTVDPKTDDYKTAMLELRKIDGVKMVYFDGVNEMDTHASIPLIGADTLWDNPDIGGMAAAGAGIKIASVDGGVHHLAPMFDGTGFDYPADFPEGGLGLTENNNGKIIASRAYFRAWDPPAPGDENPWPGENGTSHGVHTASTAAGNPFTGNYIGSDVDVSGVAPAAWVMSYRVFYASELGIGSVYDTELLAALDDVIADGADVLNNSWGGGAESAGGTFDAVDTALRNVVAAGIFVSMSNGNAGPYLGTGDHPSSDYINVAATTTDSAYGAGKLNVSAPKPISDTLQDIPFLVANFGAYPELGVTHVFTYITAASVDAANFEGCDPFPAGTFDSAAAVISRGACDFSSKVYNAQEAGAEFVVIHNDEARGDASVSMAAGENAELVTISSVFVGYSYGAGMTVWQDTYGADSELTLDMNSFLISREPDIVTDFSSRGPGVGFTLKPDIAAPGDYIMAQGYAEGVSGEDRHLGIGQASGTSMAAPHVAGAAALLLQVHPEWTPAEVKSALMSTSKYMDIYNADGSPAQPLDMGAGRLDLTNAADPGVILDPPSISFGRMVTGTTVTVPVWVTNITGMAETYTVTSLYTGDGYTPTLLTEVTGVSIDVTSITLQPGESKQIEVTFDSSVGDLIGDNQGFLILEGEMHNAHMPLWARVVDEPQADVLIIQNDGALSLGMPNYLGFYTTTLDNLGLTYDTWNADQWFSYVSMIPNASYLAGYEMILYFTGDYFFPDGSFTVSTALTIFDQQILIEYANAGGKLLMMGQDMNEVLGDDTLRSHGLGWGSDYGYDYFWPAVSGHPAIAAEGAPPMFEGVEFDMSGYDEACVPLLGANVEPPVATVNTGEVCGTWYEGYPAFEINGVINAIENTKLQEIGLYTSTMGTLGNTPVATFDVPTTTLTATMSWAFDDTIVDSAVTNALLSGDLVLLVSTSAEMDGELAAYVDYASVGDGAWNQDYVDEIFPVDNPDAMPLLQIPDAQWCDYDCTVALGVREQPTLEKPGTSKPWRSIYATFGLEGVNNLGATDWREDMFLLFYNWLFDEPMVEINVVDFDNASGLSTFEVVDASMMPVSATSADIMMNEFYTYRWDFGDGSPIVESSSVNLDDLTPMSTHVYDECKVYTVSVEVINQWGNHAVASIDYAPCELIFMPWIMSTP